MPKDRKDKKEGKEKRPTSPRKREKGSSRSRSRSRAAGENLGTSPPSTVTSASSPGKSAAGSSLPDAEESDDVQLYDVKTTDTLRGIALWFNVPVDTLRKLNGMTSKSDIYGRKVLKIPKDARHKPVAVAVAGSFDETEAARMQAAEKEERGGDDVKPNKSADDLDLESAGQGDVFGVGMELDGGKEAADEGWELVEGGRPASDAKPAILEPFSTGLHDATAEPSAPHLDKMKAKADKKQRRQGGKDAVSSDDNGGDRPPPLLHKKHSQSLDRGYSLKRSLEIRKGKVVDKGIQRQEFSELSTLSEDTEDSHHHDETNFRAVRRYTEETITMLQDTDEHTNWLMEHDAAWDGVILPATHGEAREKLKFLIRRGVPDALRPPVWKLITGVSDFVKENPDFYEDALKRTFGDDVPDEFLTVPVFGGELRPQDHFLTGRGVKAAQRILCVLASNHADIEYLPVITDLACLLLTFFDEGETYVALHCMAVQSRSQKEHIKYFLPTKKEVHVFLHTFEDLLKKRDKKIFMKMKELGVSSHDFADEWFMRLFLNDFPFQACLRFFDAFLSEGRKILFRVGLAHLKLCKVALMEAQSKDHFVGIIRQRAAQTPDPTSVLKKAFELQLQRKEFHRYNEKNRAKVLHVEEPHIPVYYKPIIRDKSTIISDMQFELLYRWLPNRFGIEDPVKLYSSAQEGYSLHHFIEKMGRLPPSKQTPTIFIIKTARGEVFGAFLGVHAAFEYSAGSGYAGERDCFLWTFVAEPMKFGWYEGCADFFLRIEKSRGIFIGGGGGNGLYLDADMNRGSTQKCDTFANTPLTHDHREDFMLASFEVYGFE